MGAEAIHLLKSTGDVELLKSEQVGLLTVLAEREPLAVLGPG